MACLYASWIYWIITRLKGYMDMFKKLHKKLLFIIMFCSYSILQAAIPNTDDPTSFVGATGKAKYATSITENTALSLLGEAGPRNYRLGGTLGWRFNENQRLKISGDFLRQDIVYAFFSGNSREWVKQGAIGAHYQYDLNQPGYNPQFNLKAGYSHAPSRQLDTVAGSYIDVLGLAHNFIDYRRIAGSDAGYISPGISVQPWQTARVGVELNYDDVQYDRIFYVDQRAKGFGGTANLVQQLGANTKLGMSVGIREPFNAYQANIGYTLPNSPDWTLGIDANYVDGKHYLPNTYNVGLSVSYVVKEEQLNPNNLEKDPTIRPAYSDLSSWVADPAIYLPQVLAITDEGVIFPVVVSPVTPTPPAPPICLPPTLVGVMPNITVTNANPIPISAAGFFSGTAPLTYSAVITNVNPAGPNPTVTINAATGDLVITPQATGTNYSFTVTVTATNSCGSIPTSFTVFANLD